MPRSTPYPKKRASPKKTTWYSIICPLHQSQKSLQYNTTWAPPKNPPENGLPSKQTDNIKKPYRDSKVKNKVGRCKLSIDYTTGVHQGDNMSTVLFLFHNASLPQHHIDTQPAELTHFPVNKKRNIVTCRGRHLCQDVSAQGKSLNFWGPFYEVDSTFSLKSHFDLDRTATTLYKHFAHVFPKNPRMS